MKNIFFKIFLIIFSIAVAIFVIAMGYSAYQYYKAIHADDPINPYVLVEKWSTRIVRGNITIQLDTSEQYNIQEKDTIIVHPESESTIFWPDHSTTQLGSDSTFAIQKMQVADDYSKIEIEATLLQGKIYTNMIRTLYPWSRMTVNVPKHNIVAGVRGTVFSLNLDQNYIHSIDHAVMLELRGIFTQNSLLLPGEIAQADNIFIRLGKDVLDTLWEDAMNLKNETYTMLYMEKVSWAWEKLMWKLGETSWWDELVRMILSWFDAFKDIKIMEAISSLDINQISEYSQAELMSFYQKFKIGDFALERDVLRGAMYQLSQADAKMQELLEILASESLWEKMEFPTLNLQNTEKILDDFGAKMTIDIDWIIRSLSEKNYGTELLDSVGNFFTIPLPQ